MKKNQFHYKKIVILDDMNDLWLGDQNEKDVMNKSYLVGDIKASSNVYMLHGTTCNSCWGPQDRSRALKYQLTLTQDIVYFISYM